jgi:hypothetical protein
MAEAMSDFISDADMGSLEKAGKAKMPTAPTSSDFIPDDQMAHLERSGKAKPPEKEGAGQAALEAYGNTATGGYLPHVQAAAAKGAYPTVLGLLGRALSDPSDGVDADLEKKGFKIQNAPEKSYVQERDENIARQKQQGKDFPNAVMAGKAAGIVGGGLMIPGGAWLGEGSLAVRAAKGAVAGGALGGLQNPGDVEGDITVMPMERLKNATGGAVLGGLAPPIIAGASALVGKGADALKTAASERAFRALGRNNPKAMQAAVNSGQNVAIGRELLDEGAIPILGTPGRIASRVDKLKEAAGEEIGGLVKGAGNAKVVDAEKLGLEILDSPELALMRKTPSMEGAVANIEKQVETLAKNGQMDVGEAQTLRQAIDEALYKHGRSPEFTGAQEGLYLQRTGLRDAMNEGINKLTPGAPKDQLLAANHKYSNMATASDVLEKELARNQSNRSISLTDTIAAGAGASTGSPAAALILGALNKTGRTFGNSMKARGYDALANMLAKSAPVVAAAESNPGVVAKLASTLGQEMAGGKQDYSADTDPALNDPELLMLFKKDKNLIDSVQDPRRRALIKEKLKRMPAGQ